MLGIVFAWALDLTRSLPGGPPLPGEPTGTSCINPRISCWALESASFVRRDAAFFRAQPLRIFHGIWDTAARAQKEPTMTFAQDFLYLVTALILGAATATTVRRESPRRSYLALGSSAPV